MHSLWARCRASLSRCCALLAHSPLDDSRCRATHASCLAPPAHCCTPPALPRDTRTLLRAAWRLPDDARKFPRCLARCHASSARCRAPPSRLALCSAPQLWEGPLTPQNSAQFTCCASKWINRTALVFGDHKAFLWRTFLKKIGIVNLVLTFTTTKLTSLFVSFWFYTNLRNYTSIASTPKRKNGQCLVNKQKIKSET